METPTSLRADGAAAGSDGPRVATPDGAANPRKTSRRGWGSIHPRRTRAGVWIYYIRYPLGGKRVWEACGPHKRDAESRLAEVRKSIAEGEALGIRPVTATTFAEFRAVVEPVLRRHAPDTFAKEQARYRILADHFGATPLHEIATPHLRDFLASRMVGAGETRRPAKPATVNRWLSLLSVVFREAVERGHARANLTTGIKREREALKPVPYLAPADVAKYLAACAEDVHGPALVAVDSGLRRKEILRLTRADVDRTAGRHGALVVRRSKSRPRIVPMTARLREFLDRLLAARRGPAKLAGTEPLFPAFQGGDKEAQPLTDGAIAAAKKAGFPGLTLHGLRHVFGSSLARAGVPVSTIATLLGVSIATALRYVRHCPQGHEFAAIDRLEEAQRQALGGAPSALNSAPAGQHAGQHAAGA